MMFNNAMESSSQMDRDKTILSSSDKDILSQPIINFADEVEQIDQAILERNNQQTLPASRFNRFAGCFPKSIAKEFEQQLLKSKSPFEGMDTGQMAKYAQDNPITIIEDEEEVKK